MLTYIVGFIAFLVLLSNPIYEALWPRQKPFTTRLPYSILSNDSLLALQDDTFDLSLCPRDEYTVRIFSKEPFMLYIENFLSKDERRHILEISEPIFEPSTITNDGATTHQNATVRNSETALLPRTPTVRCVEQRALALQGWRGSLFVERLRSQRYLGPGGHYSHHYDFSASSALTHNAKGWGRVGSVMAWVHASDDLRGGGTEFPLMPLPNWAETSNAKWCGDGGGGGGGGGAARADSAGGGEGKERRGLVRCEEGYPVTGMGGPGKGIEFSVRPGNAVFWANFDGRGDAVTESWHAGLPVEEGTKVGLNIWSFGTIA